MRHLTLALATAASVALSTPAAAGPTEDFHALMDAYWAAYLKDNPLTASSVGGNVTPSADTANGPLAV